MQTQKALEDVRELLIHLASGGGWKARWFVDDITGRKICCTPFDGHYGQAGWIIAVNGSPPRCEILVNSSSHWTPIVIVNGTPKRLGDKQAKVVSAFVGTWLADRDAAFEIGNN